VKRWLMVLFTVGVVMLLAAIPALALLQETTATAEALGQANLRSTTDVNAPLVGQITSGTAYPIIGRSELYPWYLLGDDDSGQPIGWVYAELVSVRGDVNLVPFSTTVVDENAAATPAPSVSPAANSTAAQATAEPGLVGVAVPLEPSATPTLSGNVIGTVVGEINIRFGPGTEYPRIGVGKIGEQFQISAWHTQLPWIQIRYDAAPNGFGWVQMDLLEVKGDIFTLPSISQTIFDLPTLTPTPPVVQSSALFGTPAALSPQFQTLGESIWNMMLTAKFDPLTSRQGALFLMDLQTGETITFGNRIAFSGMSITKIAILAATYEQMDTPPDVEEAMDIANMMVCSENTASNQLLSNLGEGDEYRGAQAVTRFLNQLGLQDTYMTAPFIIPGVSTPQPAPIPTTGVDQRSAQPDPYNQMTVDQLGLLLNGIYQCAYNNSGPLLSAFPGRFDQRECRQMLDVMSSNNLSEPLLMSAGVPPEIRVAHKHGWTPDTHGNAGIVFTPGGNYVLVVALHNPTWLDFGESFPLITEISRTIYNYYNPDTPMGTPREPNIIEVAECQLLGNPIIEELISLEMPDI
jgi:uncharacterized protein YraI